MDNNEPAVAPNTPLIIEIHPGNELTELIPVPVPERESTMPGSDNAPADPEFDAYMAVVKLLVGGTVEGTAELLRRLETWQAELDAAEGQAEAGEVRNPGDMARFMFVGIALSSADGVRRQAIKLAQASDLFWRMTGSAAQPFVKNRLTGVVARPLDRAFERLALRGQKRVEGWIELGRTEEPAARRLARKTYLEVVDEFIGHLAENQELAELVQEQSVGLASEAVDEIRSRTVSADALAEGIVRRILRRPPRHELPPPSEEIRQALADSSKATHRP